MSDNIDLSIEKLYEAYERTSRAEAVINDAKNVIYSYSKLELPAKKFHVKGYQYNQGLIRDDYLSTMGKLEVVFGRTKEGTVGRTKKHLHNLMRIVAESDARAKMFFEEMQKKEMVAVEAFGSDVNTEFAPVGEYGEVSSMVADTHNGEAKFNQLQEAYYEKGTEAASYYGEAQFSEPVYFESQVANVSTTHEPILNTYVSNYSGYEAAPVEAIAMNVERPQKFKPNETVIADYIALSE